MKEILHDFIDFLSASNGRPISCQHLKAARIFDLSKNLLALDHMKPIANPECELILLTRHAQEVFVESTFHLIGRNFLIYIRAMLVELIGVFQPLQGCFPV
jgi:hypothetical protein